MYLDSSEQHGSHGQGLPIRFSAPLARDRFTYKVCQQQPGLVSKRVIATSVHGAKRSSFTITAMKLWQVTFFLLAYSSLLACVHVTWPSIFCLPKAKQNGWYSFSSQWKMQYFKIVSVIVYSTFIVINVNFIFIIFVQFGLLVFTNSSCPIDTAHETIGKRSLPFLPLRLPILVTCSDPVSRFFVLIVTKSSCPLCALHFFVHLVAV